MNKEDFLQQEVYRLSRILTTQGWAVGQLKILVEHSNRDYAIKQSEDIVEKLRKLNDKEQDVYLKNFKSLMDGDPEPSKEEQGGD